jgi:hypothetical protein
MAQKVLRFTQDEMAARVEVAQQGGRVIHQFSPTAFVAELPDAVDLMSLAKSTAQPTQPLDVVTQLAVTAWTTVQADKRARAVAAPSPTEGLPWDTPGFEPPREFGTSVAAARAGVDTEVVAESTGTPTSLYMIGSVAVGLVLVSRNIGGEVLTDAERTTIVQEVQEGLDWLVGVEPRARVSFIYDIRPVTVSSAPGPYPGVTDPYERFERDWRDAALAAMGYAAGRPGYQQYANDLRSSRQTDWAYVAFFTKYALQHFAYAVNEKVVMNYANDGWGPDNINRVFAHESCHIFGAADEYGSCVCGSASGHLGVPNNNCVNCFPPGAQVPCLMNANTLAMCEFSRRQIGWDERLFPRLPGFILQTGTVLHETGDEFDFALATNGDLLAIKRQGGGTNSTEVHVLAAANSYQQFSLQTGTALHPTDGSWAFAIAPNRDLFAIKKQGGGTNSTELHVLAAAGDYQQFSLQTGTGLHPTDGTWAFAVATNRDVIAIKKQGGGTNSTEVHILSAASNYQQFALQTGTALHPTDDNWAFAAADNRDVFAIKKQGGSTNSTEVHVLSAGSNYQNFALHTGTALHPTPADWAFAVTAAGDLFAIKKRVTGTKSTEIHVIDLP